MKQPRKRYILVVLLCTMSSIYGVDNQHYYKAPYHNATKSWKNKDWLSIFDAHYAYGSTHRSRDTLGNSAGAFEAYGCHNMLYLPSNVPTPANISSTLLGYVNNLAAQRTSFENDNPADKQTFGLVEFSGKCEVNEFVLNYRQNLVRSLFLELNIPIRRVSTGPKTLIDKSPSSAIANDPYTQTDTIWLDFINNLEDILVAYGLDGYQASTRNTSLGDISLLGGWQRTFNTKKNILSLFEYIKFAIKLGVLFPTGSHRKFTKPFSLETGYNGHWGLPIRSDIVFGLSSDIYWGNYIGATFFSSRIHDGYPVMTHETQNGFIKLYRTKIREKKGSLFDVGTYLKLDHFFKGLSALAGYSYNRQSSDSLSLAETCGDTNNSIINKDSRLKSWYQHVLHLLAQYDFGVHDCFKKRKWQPRIGIFYDHPFDGKRAIMNAMVGGTIGCDVSWRW